MIFVNIYIDTLPFIFGTLWSNQMVLLNSLILGPIIHIFISSLKYGAMLRLHSYLLSVQTYPSHSIALALTNVLLFRCTLGFPQNTQFDNYLII